jgi:hypothetical protein
MNLLGNWLHGAESLGSEYFGRIEHSLYFMEPEIQYEVKKRGMNHNTKIINVVSGVIGEAMTVGYGPSFPRKI